MSHEKEIARRRAFAIISHPDAGKTTLTEKLLLFGGALREAGAVRAQKASRYATSDWLELEKQRGISVSSSVMHFEHAGHRVNILDTPGHKDFSEDTYRTLTVHLPYACRAPTVRPWSTSLMPRRASLMPPGVAPGHGGRLPHASGHFPHRPPRPREA